MATTTADVVAFVTRAFIRDGKDLSIAEIAARMEVSESSVRRALSAAHGCPNGRTCSQESRERYEKNYGTQSGYSRVWVYGPTRAALARMLRDAPDL